MKHIQSIDIEEIEQCYKLLFYYEGAKGETIWTSLYISKDGEELEWFFKFGPIRDVGHVWVLSDQSISEGEDVVHGVVLYCINYFEMTKVELWMPYHAWEEMKDVVRDLPKRVEKTDSIPGHVLAAFGPSTAQVEVKEHWKADTPHLEVSKRFRDHVIKIGKNVWNPGADVTVSFWNDVLCSDSGRGSLVFLVTKDDRRVLNGGIINHSEGEPNFSVHT